MNRTVLVAALAASLALATAAPVTAQPSVELPGAPEVLAPGTGPDFSKLGRMRNDHALRLFEEKKYPEALEALREAREMNPEDAEITNNLAYLLQVLGSREEAETWYRRTLELDPERAVALLNLSDLLAADDPTGSESGARLAEAASLLIRVRELRGNQRKLILRQARIATRRGLFEDGERFWRELREHHPVDDRLRLEIGDFYRSFGREHDALEWYRSVREGSETSQQAERRERQVTMDREARRLGWLPGPETVPAQARILTTRGRLQLEHGEHEEAERILREAVALAPTFAEAHAALGDVLRAAGRLDDAEVADLRALALDHGNPEAHARLGRLYMDAAGGRRATEAALFLGNALRLRPEWTTLHLELARAYQGSGALEEAAAHAEAYLDTETDPAGREEAAALLRQLQGAVTAPPSRIEATDAAEALEATVAMTRARVLLAGGETDAALEVLLRVPDGGRNAAILDLEARCLVAKGDRARAIRTLQTALIEDDDRPETHLLLGRLFLEAAEGARALGHLDRARDGGLAEASWLLANLTLGTWRDGATGWLGDLGRRKELRQALDHLDAYLGTGEERRRIEAEALSGHISVRLLSQRNAGIGLAGALVLLGLLWALRRRGGVGLDELIRRSPETGPEVQRILAAIRHEILKHNTLLLAGLVEALELDRDASEKAIHLSESLFGPGGRGGVKEHLLAYIRELESLGRARGLRLNLRRRDPAAGALLRGFDALSAARPLLDRETTLEPGERVRLLGHLRTASQLLNVEAYEALRGILDRLRTLAVDEELLLGVVERVRREPALSRLAVARPDVEIDVDLPVGVLVPRAAFEDALGNLVRNALRSSADHGQSPIRLGLAITSEIDPVIGVERVAFHVRDASPAQLTTEMIRSRHLEGGLGIASDVVARYEGTIEVIHGSPPWTKALVMTFDRTHPEEDA